MRINTTKENSFEIGNSMYITLLKAQKISVEAKQFVDHNDFIVHPKMGKMVRFAA